MASNASAEVSNYWLYFDNGTTRNVPSLTECYQAAWWTTQATINAIANKAFVAKLDGSDNGGTPYFTDKTRASFKLEASTNTTTVSGFNGATRVKATCGLYLDNPDGHTQFAGSTTIKDEKYAAFWYSENVVK